MAALACYTDVARTDFSTYNEYETTINLKGVSVRVLPDGWTNLKKDDIIDQIGHTVAISEQLLIGERALRLYCHPWIDLTRNIHAGIFLGLEDIEPDDNIRLSVSFRCECSSYDSFTCGTQFVTTEEFGPRCHDIGVNNFIRFHSIRLPNKLRFKVWMKMVD